MLFSSERSAPGRVSSAGARPPKDEGRVQVAEALLVDLGEELERAVGRDLLRVDLRIGSGDAVQDERREAGQATGRRERREGPAERAQVRGGRKRRHAAQAQVRCPVRREGRGEQRRMASLGVAGDHVATGEPPVELARGADDVHDSAAFRATHQVGMYPGCPEALVVGVRHGVPRLEPGSELLGRIEGVGPLRGPRGSADVRDPGGPVRPAHDGPAVLRRLAAGEHHEARDPDGLAADAGRAVEERPGPSRLRQRIADLASPDQVAVRVLGERLRRLVELEARRRLRHLGLGDGRGGHQGDQAKQGDASWTGQVSLLRRGT